MSFVVFRRTVNSKKQWQTYVFYQHEVRREEPPKWRSVPGPSQSDSITSLLSDVSEWLFGSRVGSCGQRQDGDWEEGLPPRDEITEDTPVPSSSNSASGTVGRTCEAPSPCCASCAPPEIDVRTLSDTGWRLSRWAGTACIARRAGTGRNAFHFRRSSVTSVGSLSGWQGHPQTSTCLSTA